jgi:lipid-A-disaccharide synthase
MANLIAGKEAVPELIQHDFTAEKIVQHLETLLPDGSTRESMKEELAAIRQALGGGGAIARVAEFVTRELHLSSPAAVAASQP